MVMNLIKNKMNLSNKVVSVMLAVFLCLLLIPNSVFAADEVTTEEQLNAAIAAAPVNVETVITIKEQIALADQVVIPKDKIIVLKADSVLKAADEPALVRKQTYIGNVLALDAGAKLITKDIIISGQRKVAGYEYMAGTLVFTKGTYEIQSGTVLRDNYLSKLNMDINGTAYSTAYSGGGVYATGVDALVDMKGGLVSNNYCSSNGGQGLSGGGIAAWHGAEVKMSGGEVSGNSSSSNGAGIMSTGKVTISGKALISKNVTKSSGGGICVYGSLNQDYAELNITGGTITENSGGNGGGIYTYHNNPGGDLQRRFTPVSITGGVISYNKASSSGGGYGFAISDAKIGGDVIFEHNEAAANAGAVGGSSNQVSDLTITGGIFRYNTAGQIGGAVYLNSGSTFNPNGLRIYGGTFTNNEAYRGGAIGSNCEANTYIEGKANDKIMISENKASVGGAIIINGYFNESFEKSRKTIIKNTIIKNNTAFVKDAAKADKEGVGGGIALSYHGIVDLSEGTFITGNKTVDENNAVTENKGSGIVYDPNWRSLYNRIYVSGKVQIGTNDDDNGVYLPTYRTYDGEYDEDYNPIDVDEDGDPIYTAHEQAVEIKGVLDSASRINIQGAMRWYNDKKATEIEDTKGRIVVYKGDGIIRPKNVETKANTVISQAEADCVYYQGPVYSAILNKDNNKQVILDIKEETPPEDKDDDNGGDDNNGYDNDKKPPKPDKDEKVDKSKTGDVNSIFTWATLIVASMVFAGATLKRMKFNNK